MVIWVIATTANVLLTNDQLDMVMLLCFVVATRTIVIDVYSFLHNAKPLVSLFFINLSSHKLLEFMTQCKGKLDYTDN